MVGVVSLLAITPSLELISSMINFGALVAFTFVNLSVIAYFAVRRREYRTAKQVARNVALPLIGTAHHRRAVELPAQGRPDLRAGLGRPSAWSTSTSSAASLADVSRTSTCTRATLPSQPRPPCRHPLRHPQPYRRLCRYPRWPLRSSQRHQGGSSRITIHS